MRSHGKILREKLLIERIDRIDWGKGFRGFASKRLKKTEMRKKISVASHRGENRLHRFRREHPETRKRQASREVIAQLG